MPSKNCNGFKDVSFSHQHKHRGFRKCEEISIVHNNSPKKIQTNKMLKHSLFHAKFFLGSTYTKKTFRSFNQYSRWFKPQSSLTFKNVHK